MTDLTTALNTIRHDFATYDTAANGGDTDGLISRNDLKAVADGSQYTAEQRAAAQYLLDNPDRFDAIDIAKNGGDQDGLFSKGDLKIASKDAPLYERTSAFHTAKPEVDPRKDNSDTGSPKGAAAQLQRLQTQDRDTSNPDLQPVSTGYFTNVVGKHKNDPQWLHRFFQALGSEQATKYLIHVSDPNRYSGLLERQADSAVGDVRIALETLYASGGLNDADVSRIVETWARQGGDPKTGLPQLFAGLDGPHAQGLKNAFANAAIELSVSGVRLENPRFTFDGDAADWLSKGDRNGLAAAGAYVLGGTSRENQVAQLARLREEGGDSAVTTFVSEAMAGPTSVDAINALTREAQQQVQMGKGNGRVDYAGVGTLVQSLAGADPARTPGLLATRDAVFASASIGLDQHAAGWERNTTLKDGLSTIFMSDYDNLIKPSISPNGQRLDVNSSFPRALQDFAQHVLFTKPQGAQRDRASQFLIHRYSSTVKDINGLTDTEFQARYGMNKLQASDITGQVLGYVQNGCDKAVGVASDKHAAQRQALEFGINLAVALGTDLLKVVPGGSVAEALIPGAISGSASYALIKDQVNSYIKSGAIDKAADLLLDKLPGFNPDQALTSLENHLESIVKADGPYNYADAMGTAYTRAQSNA